MLQPNLIKPIVNLKKLTDECRQVAAKALANKYVSFCRPQDVADNKVIYIMTAPGSTRARDKYSYTVIPICSSDYKIFWLGASLEFQYRQGKAFFVGTSIIVFEGQPNDDDKVPLFRAEWEVSENAQVNHAQPHWHIYAGRINQQPTETFFEETLIEFSTDLPIQQQPLGNVWEEGQWFHFAMASQWHIGTVPPAYVHLDHEQIKHWLYGCISYTIEQIRWIYEK